MSILSFFKKLFGGSEEVNQAPVAEATEVKKEVKPEAPKAPVKSEEQTQKIEKRLAEVSTEKKVTAKEIKAKVKTPTEKKPVEKKAPVKAAKAPVEKKPAEKKAPVKKTTPKK